jgi:hypothetical protein
MGWNLGPIIPIMHMDMHVCSLTYYELTSYVLSVIQTPF